MSKTLWLAKVKHLIRHLDCGKDGYVITFVIIEAKDYLSANNQLTEALKRYRWISPTLLYLSAVVFDHYNCSVTQSI